MKEPRMLVGVLYSGENEFGACIRSLEAQTFKNLELKIFEHLPNKEAHDALYREFTTRAGEFDLFLKLDADMVFRDNDAIRKAVTLFKKSPGLDHLEMAVHDWYSDSLIMGVHFFTNRAVWRQNEEDLFVDPDPVVPGATLRLWTSPAPVIDHCPDPSPFQAYHFGVHRGLKAVQPGRWLSFDPFDSKNEWRILKSTWEHFVRVRDRRLAFAVLGATHVMDGHVFNKHYDYTNKELREYFDRELSSMDECGLYDLLASRWERKGAREAAHYMRVGPRCLLGLGLESARRARKLLGTR